MRTSPLFLFHIALLTIALVFVSGCAEPPPTSTTSSSASKKRSSAPPPPPPGATDPGGANVQDHVVEGPEEPELEREVAKAGVGKKGRNYGGGIISEPVHQYFHQGQRIEFMKVTSAKNLYKGEHGYFPKTEEEFMTKIIKFNSIELPELPAGEKYVYEPKTGELMVERPKK